MWAPDRPLTSAACVVVDPYQRMLNVTTLESVLPNKVEFEVVAVPHESSALQTCLES